MKSFPSCWNKTLTQLGFRRKIRKYKSRCDYGRRFQFENLEPRQMLATDIAPTLFNVASGNTNFQVQYNITGDTAANPFAISVYRSTNGSTPVGTALVTFPVTATDKLALGTGHIAQIPTANFSDPLVSGLYTDYYLVAVVDSLNQVTETAIGGANRETNNNRSFVGGIFQAGDGIHVHGTVSNDSIGVSFNDSTGDYTITSGAHTYTTDTPGEAFRIRAQQGNDSVNIDSDVLLPTFVFGGGGSDTINGGGGNDLIDGGDYGDSLYGNGGDDIISGGAEWDTIVGGAGNDLLTGGGGLDAIYGGTGDDTIDGGDYGDMLYGEGGHDIIYGGGGGDTIVGGTDNDILFGGLDGDLLQGGDSDDILYGEAGNDTLQGQAGNDILIQGSGIGTMQWQTGISNIPDDLIVRTLADENASLGTTSFKMANLSLREALAAAAAQVTSDTIRFDSNLHASGPATLTLNHSFGELVIDDTAAINVIGPGANLLTIDADRDSAAPGEAHRVLYVDENSNVSLSGITMTGGTPNESGLFSYLERLGAGVLNLGTLVLNSVVVTDNRTENRGGGGGIYNLGHLEILSSTISGNRSGENGGGGVFAGGTVLIANSAIINNRADYYDSDGGGITVGQNAVVQIYNTTISGNLATGSGGGISDGFMSAEGGAAGGATVTIVNSTITGNEGGGIYLTDYDGPSVWTLRNSIVAGNQGYIDWDINGLGDSIAATSSYNIVGVDLTGELATLPSNQSNRLGLNPLLGPLANNGGPTLTHALQPGSPAIDRGDPNFNPSNYTPPLDNDQRGAGFARIRGGGVDIGAFETPEINLWREAENTNSLTSPMHVVGDLTASGNRLVSYFLDTSLTASNPTSPTQGIATYNFDVTTAGTYAIWARTIAPHSNADAFSVRIDNGPWILWNSIANSTTWQWSKIHNSNSSNQPLAVSLSAGQHVLRIAYRDDAAQLDKLLITNNLQMTPVGEGEDDPGLTGLKTVDLTATVRDFHAEDWDDGSTTEGHPDFERSQQGLRTGLVEDYLLNGKPVYVGGPQLTGEAEFEQWFNDDPSVNRSKDITLRMMEDPFRPGVYQFVGSLSSGVTASTHEFYPIDDQLFADPASGLEQEPQYSDGAGKADEIVEDHNYHFTMELNAEFTYVPGQVFEILQADDDLWVFINNELVVDLGGVHGPASAAPVELDDLGLIPGQTYRFDLFFAERHTEQSHLVFETNIATLRQGVSLTEEERLVTTDEHPTANDAPTSFIVPPNPESLQIDFSDLWFDTASQNPADVNDAFEIVILKTDGTSALPTISPDSDAIFNITQGRAPVWSAGVEMWEAGTGLFLANPTAGLTEGRILIDISSLTPGTEIQLVARLVNNDADDDTRVTVDFNTDDSAQGTYHLQGNGSARPLPSASNGTATNQSSIGFGRLENVTSTFDIGYTHTTWSEGQPNTTADNTLRVGVNITKRGQLSVRDTLLLALPGLVNQGSSSPTNARSKNYDGLLPFDVAGIAGGTPYFDLSHLLPKEDTGFFTDDAAIANLVMKFLQKENLRFDYELVLLGNLNEAPEFTSDPYAAQQGQAYPVEIYSNGQFIPVLEIVANGNDNQLIYTPTAVDPDNDSVEISILTGPAGVAINPAGNLVWTPSSSNVGTHVIRLRATDEFGSFDSANDQLIMVRVVHGIPNRPPRFTTDPSTSATVGEPYHYDSNAFDADGDGLTYTGTASYTNVDGVFVSLNGSSADSDEFTVNDSTGVLTWIPPTTARGRTVRVTMKVTDGNGPLSQDIQSYDIEVVDSNRPPVITKLPSTHYVIPGTTLPMSGDVTPDSPIILNLGPGESANQVIKVRIPTSGEEYEPPTGQSNALVVLDESDPVELRKAIVGNGGAGITVTGQSLSAPAPDGSGENLIMSTGIFVNNDNTYGLGPYGIVLSTGDAEDYGSGTYAPFNNGSTDIGYGGTENEHLYSESADTAQQNLLQPISGQGTHLDVTQFNITFDVDANTTKLYFNITIGSEEWSNFVGPGSTVIDAFGIYLTEPGGNPVNKSFVDAYGPAANHPTRQTGVVPSSVAQGAFIGSQAINVNHPQFAQIPGTELDGVLAPGGNPVYTFEVDVTPNSIGNVLTFIIADSGDARLDTTAFISSLGGTPPAPVDVELIASNGNVVTPALPLEQDTVPLGSEATFNVQFVGDGQAHAFDLIIREPGGGGATYGRLPVFINSVYESDADAVDIDNDPINYTFLDEFDVPTQTLHGATIDPQTGEVYWNPTVADSYEFTIQASDNRGGKDIETYTVVVEATNVGNNNPDISSAAPEDAQVGRQYEYQVLASDADNDPLRYFLMGDVPEAMSIDQVSGLISWTPTVNDLNPGQLPRTYDFDVYVSDSRGGFDTQQVTLEVVGPETVTNRAPNIISQPITTALESTEYLYKVVAEDRDGDPITYRLVTAPSGMIINKDTGQIVWTPTRDQEGTQHVFVEAVDKRGASAAQRFDIKVSVINDSPEITSTPPKDAASGVLYTYQVLATDPNGDDLHYEVDPLSVSRGITIDDNGLLEWTPSGFGVATIGVRVTDGRGGEDIQYFDLSIVANASPRIDADISGAIFLNELVNIQVTADDPEDGVAPTSGLTFSIDQNSVDRGVSINPSTGTLSWTPYALGTFFTTVTVTDSGGAWSTLELTLPVNKRPEINDPPRITSTPTGPAVRDRAWSYQVVATDPDNDVVTLTLVDPPSWLQPLNPESGPGFGKLTLSGTPDGPGPYPITVLAEDGEGNSYEQIFNLTVIANAPPIIVEAVQRAGAVMGQPATYNVVAFDPNGDALTFEFVSGPGSGSFGAVTNGVQPGTRQSTLTFTPSSDGTSEVIVRVSDGTDSATHLMTLVITDPNQVPPIASLQAPTVVFAGDEFVAQVNASDANNDDLTYSFIDDEGRLFTEFAEGSLAAMAEGAPIGASIDPETGLITWTPTSEQVLGIAEPPYQFKVRVSDGRYAVDLGPVNVRVATRPNLPQNPPQFVRAVSTGVIPLSVASQLPFDFIDFDGDAVNLSYVVTQGSGAGAFNWTNGSPASDDPAHPSSAVLTFTPTAAGPTVIQVTVADANGYSTHIVQLNTVDTSQPNRQPVVSLTARTATAAGERFVAQVEATDPDGDTLAYALSFPDPARQPDGMTIDAVTGQISWTPTSGDVTPDNGLPYVYVITVDDGNNPPVEIGPVELTVVSRFTNSAPVITSNPNSIRGVGDDILVYQATANDPDGDPVVWSVESDVSGVTIDPVTGRVVWRPDTSIRQEQTYVIRVTATDPYGASGSQLVQLRTTPGNTAPRITSTPPQPGFGGEDWNYLVRATDADGDAFTFSLTGQTAGITITPLSDTTARVSWLNPTAAATRSFQVVVTDVHGLSGGQSVSLTIGSPGTNPSVDVPPIITSVPAMAVLEGQAYRYQVVAEDPDGPVVYALASQAPWLSINNGLVSGTAPIGGPSSVVVTVTATQAGVTVSQSYTLTINTAAGNALPEIIPASGLTAVADQRFTYDVVARDADGDYPLQYFLVDNQGDDRNQYDGFEISANGRVTWTATGTNRTFTVRVRDARGGIDQQSFNVAVLTDDPPLVQLDIPSGLSALAGQLVAIRVLAQDDHGILGDSRRVILQNTTLFGSGGLELPVASNGVAQWLIPDDFGSGMSGPLQITVTGSAADTANQRTNATPLLLQVQPRNNLAPITRILAPQNNAVLEEPFGVYAKAFDSQNDLIRYTLRLVSPNGNSTVLVNQTGNPLANFGSEASAPGLLATIDPADYANGDYRLQLEATDLAGNVSLSEVSLTLEGGVDLGAMRVGFVDLVIPVRGLPITLTRSYDSERSGTPGDFGFGWELEITGIEIDVEYPDDIRDGGGFPVYEDGVRVVFSLPDGTKEGFTFQATPTGGELMGQPLSNTYYPAFIPDQGVTSALSVNSLILEKTSDGESYRVFGGYESGTFYNPANPDLQSLFELTLRNGTTLTFDASNGKIAYIEDRVAAQARKNNEPPTGNTLAITPYGIESTGGRNVQFIRDGAGRITSIVDPSGNALVYAYDENGNLESFTDRTNNETRYEYSTQEIHYLSKIIDPLGRSAARTYYDELGRIDRVIDADNNLVDHQWNSEGNRLTTYEILDGNKAIRMITDYDIQENPIRVETTLLTGVIVTNDSQGLPQTASGGTPVGATSITKTVYNERNQVVTDKVVVGLEDGVGGNLEDNDLKFTNIYNPATGELIGTIDARGNTTETRYNDFGRPIYVVDTLGNVTINNYDDTTGRLSSFSANGVRSSLSYDEDGNLTSIVNDNTGEVVISNSYNEYGDITRTAVAGGKTTHFEYDDLGNVIESSVIESVDHDLDSGTPNIEFRLWTRTEYDDENRVILVTEGKTNVSTSEETILSTIDTSSKNALGQDLVSIYTSFGAEGLNTRVETKYDTRGLAIESRRLAFDSEGDSQWFVSRSVYDSKGRITYETAEHAEGANPADIYGTYTQYDALDNIVRNEQRKGVVIDIQGTGNFEESVVSNAGSLISFTTRQFDNAGRMTQSFVTTGDIVVGNPSLTPGLVTSYTYNQFGETTEKRSELWGVGANKTIMTTRTVYDDKGRIQIVTDPYLEGSSDPVFSTETLYNGRGQAYSTIRYEGTSIAIDTDGWSTIVDRGTILTTTTKTYDDRGRVSGIISSDGQETSYEYDSLGRLVATIGPEVMVDGVLVRHRTETIYDSVGRVAITRANIIHNAFGEGMHDASDVQEVSFEHDENDNVIRTTFADGSYVLAWYNHLSRLIAESPQVAASVELSWSEMHSSFVNASNQKVPTRNYNYDAQGRLVTVTLPDPNPTDGDPTRPVYQYSYDARGQQTSLIDPLDRETIIGYDALGRQQSRTLPLGAGPDGDHETLGDNSAFSETFAYDSRGRQGLYITFEGVHVVPVYDSVTGRITSTRYFDNATSYSGGVPDEIRTYQFDNYGRQVSTTRTAGAVTRTESTTYNDRGLIESVTNNEGTILYLYDNLGRQIEVRSTTADIGATAPLAVNYENITTYSYDELGRLKTVSAIERNNLLVDVAPENGNQTDTTTYEYDLVGNLDKVFYSNGLVHDYDYDSLNRLDLLTHFIDEDGDGVLDSSDQVRSIFDYDLRADGKRSAANEQYFTNNDNIADLSNDYDWTYDDVGRLISETLYSTNSDLRFTDTFVYDLAGNRQSTTRDWDLPAKDDYTIRYEYNSNDQLETERKGPKDFVNPAAAEEVITYGYDFTQQVSKETTIDGTRTSKQEFVYNLQGQMSLVKISTYAANGVTLTRYVEEIYEYDAAGNRVTSTHGEKTDGTTNITSRTRTEYLTDVKNHTGYSQVLQQTDNNASGTVTKRIVYTLGHDQISQTVFNTANPAGVTQYFGVDGHGSVRVLYDAAAAVAQDIGSLLQVYHFDAYGNLLNFAPGVTPLTSYLHSGEAFDFNINQQYLRARWYNAANGRFNQLDPFSGALNDPQSLHKYLYAHGDPIQNVDPTGMFVGGLSGMLASIGTRVTAGGTSAVAALNALRTAKSAVEVYKAVSTLAVLANTVHDTANILFTVYDLLTFDPSDLLELKKIINEQFDFEEHIGINALPVNLPVIELQLPVKLRGKLGALFSADPTGKAAEAVGEIMAVGTMLALGVESTDIAVGYHGFDAIMFERLSDRFLFLEAKGGSAKLQTTANGTQMHHKWIDHNIDKIIQKSRGGTREYADTLREHQRLYEAGLKGMWATVVKAQISLRGEITTYFQIRTHTKLNAINTAWGKPLE